MDLPVPGSDAGNTERYIISFEVRGASDAKRHIQELAGAVGDAANRIQSDVSRIDMAFARLGRAGSAWQQGDLTMQRANLARMNDPIRALGSSVTSIPYDWSRQPTLSPTERIERARSSLDLSYAAEEMRARRDAYGRELSIASASAAGRTRIGAAQENLDLYYAAEAMRERSRATQEELARATARQTRDARMSRAQSALDEQAYLDDLQERARGMRQRAAGPVSGTTAGGQGGQGGRGGGDFYSSGFFGTGVGGVFGWAAQWAVVYGVFSGIQRAVGSVVETTRELNEEMVRYQVETGRSGEEATRFHERIKNVSRDVGLPMTAVAGTVMLAERAGLGEDYTRVAAQLQKAYGLPGEEAIQSLVMLQGQFPGVSPTTIGNRFAGLVEGTPIIDIPGLFQFFGQEAGLASQYGMDFQQYTDFTSALFRAAPTRDEGTIARFARTLGSSMYLNDDFRNEVEGLIGGSIRRESADGTSLENVPLLEVLNKLAEVNNPEAVAKVFQEYLPTGLGQPWDVIMPRFLELMSTAAPVKEGDLESKVNLPGSIEYASQELTAAWQELVSTVNGSDVIIGFLRNLAGVLRELNDLLSGKEGNWADRTKENFEGVGRDVSAFMAEQFGAPPEEVDRIRGFGGGQGQRRGVGLQSMFVGSMLRDRMQGGIYDVGEGEFTPAHHQLYADLLASQGMVVPGFTDPFLNEPTGSLNVYGDWWMSQVMAREKNWTARMNRNRLPPGFRDTPGAPNLIPFQQIERYSILDQPVSPDATSAAGMETVTSPVAPTHPGWTSQNYEYPTIDELVREFGRLLDDSARELGESLDKTARLMPSISIPSIGDPYQRGDAMQADAEHNRIIRDRARGSQARADAITYDGMFQNSMGGWSIGESGAGDVWPSIAPSSATPSWMLGVSNWLSNAMGSIFGGGGAVKRTPAVPAAGAFPSAYGGGYATPAPMFTPVDWPAPAPRGPEQFAQPQGPYIGGAGTWGFPQNQMPIRYVSPQGSIQLPKGVSVDEFKTMVDAEVARARAGVPDDKGNLAVPDWAFATEQMVAITDETGRALQYVSVNSQAAAIAVSQLGAAAGAAAQVQFTSLTGQYLAGIPGAAAASQSQLEDIIRQHGFDPDDVLNKANPVITVNPETGENVLTEVRPEALSASLANSAAAFAADTAAVNKHTAELERARRKLAAEFEGFLSGALRPSAVTDLQFAQSRVGMYQDQPDEQVRRARSIINKLNAGMTEQTQGGVFRPVDFTPDEYALINNPEFQKYFPGLLGNAGQVKPGDALHDERTARLSEFERLFYSFQTPGMFDYDALTRQYMDYYAEQRGREEFMRVAPQEILSRLPEGFDSSSIRAFIDEQNEAPLVSYLTGGKSTAQLSTDLSTITKDALVAAGTDLKTFTDNVSNMQQFVDVGGMVGRYLFQGVLRDFAQGDLLSAIASLVIDQVTAIMGNKR